MLHDPPQHEASPHGGMDSGIEAPFPFTLTLGADIRRTCSVDVHSGQTMSSFISRTL
jgi:hypothetical protein